MIDLLTVLRQAGLNVVEEGSWRSRGRPGNFGPMRGIMNHHTATPGSALRVCIEGRPDLNGPLCHLNLDRGGVFHLVSAGRANHAGLGSGSVLSRVVAGLSPMSPGPDNTDGNQYFYGIEVDNDGVGEPYPQVQLDALVRGNAAIAKAEGWNENHSIHHREWTRRKTDMSWHGDLRGEIAKHLNQPSQPSQPVKPPKPVPPVPPRHFPGDHMTRHQYHVTTLDGQGNGWLTLAGLDYTKIIGGYCHGSYPPSDGYWAVPRLAFQQRDRDTILEITGGAPNQAAIDVVVWVAD